MNALRRAREKAAPYESVQIYIYLYKGTHFILRDSSNDYRFQNYIDEQSYGFDMTIMPLPCSVNSDVSICDDAD